ncbi:hypothetical protein D7Y56_00015 (plasmid) [Streptomyces sp. S501]|uniref:hypothetical protein n=1 Tax=Streptomyces sp. S501 TaxID=2420135 RepID=UPI00106E5118|nr:hypothetical protein [Streptomyces sp. S501]QBR04494.1 hypothetical protein D7Y56_00015 [Streptomyces sp. S501]
MRALLLIALAAAAWAVWHWSRFPGKWSHAFSATYATDRAPLATRRRDLREVNKEASRAEKSARERASAEEAKYQQDIRELEDEIEGLLRPGLGSRVKGPIGDLTLYQHAVKKTGEDPAVIPLAGLTATFRSDPTYMIDLTPPSSRAHRTKYPRRREADDEATPFFTAEQLSDFAFEIMNAVADERNFQAHRDARLPRARKELETAQYNSAARDEALKNLEAVCDWQKSNPRRKEALAKLDKERHRWQQLTGKMPPR